MPNHLSVLGIIHTGISILALTAGYAALISRGKINPLAGIGKWYTILTVLTCLTSLPVMKTGHFTGAHGLAVMILVMIPLALYARSFSFLGGTAKYAETIIMSGTLFFSMIPAIVETLTRLPVSSPVAKDPASPVIKTCLLALVVLFVLLFVYQIRRVKADKSVQVSG